MDGVTVNLDSSPCHILAVGALISSLPPLVISGRASYLFRLLNQMPRGLMSLVVVLTSQDVDYRLSLEMVDAVLLPWLLFAPAP